MRYASFHCTVPYQLTGSLFFSPSLSTCLSSLLCLADSVSTLYLCSFQGCQRLPQLSRGGRLSQEFESMMRIGRWLGKESRYVVGEGKEDFPNRDPTNKVLSEKNTKLVELYLSTATAVRSSKLLMLLHCSSRCIFAHEWLTIISLRFNRHLHVIRAIYTH